MVKDLVSNKVGVHRLAIVPPKYQADKLSVSSLILSESIQELAKVPSEEEMFVLGDVKVYPNLVRRFRREEPFGIYLQIYNAGIDQASFNPELSITYRILDGKVEKLVEVDDRGESIQFYGGWRIVVLKSIPIKDLEPGRYTLQIAVEDRITEQEIVLEEKFEVQS